MMTNLTGTCQYSTMCGWCTKWDKKCDRKIGCDNEKQSRESEPTCEFCGSKNLNIQTARDLDPFYPKTFVRVQCGNCGRILFKDYEENQDE